MKYYKTDEIHYMDAGIVTAGDDRLRNLLAYALTEVPKDIVDQAFDECLFFTVDPETQGEFVPKSFIGPKSVILLPPDIFDRTYREQSEAILYQLAHFALNHKMGIDVSYHVMKRQEAEAKALVRQWLKEHANSSETETTV
jgi:hypothetical protein